MEKFKTGLIIALAILSLILGVMYDKKPVVSTNVTNGSGTNTTITTVYAKAQITGATNATTLPNGSVAVSGVNLSINTDTHLETYSTTITHFTTKQVLKYTYNTIGIGGQLSSDFNVVNYGLLVSYSNPEVSISAGYIITRKEYLIGFNKTIIGW